MHSSKQAASVWSAVRKLQLNAVARFIPNGALAGEHVVEIEPGHAVDRAGFAALLELADARGIELSYGLSPRRVLVLS